MNFVDYKGLIIGVNERIGAFFGLFGNGWYVERDIGEIWENSADKRIFPTCRAPVTTTAGNWSNNAFSVVSYFRLIHMRIFCNIIAKLSIFIFLQYYYASWHIDILSGDGHTIDNEFSASKEY